MVIINTILGYLALFMGEIAIFVMIIGILRNVWILLSSRWKKRSYPHNYVASLLAYTALSAQFLIVDYAIEETMLNSLEHFSKLVLAVALYGLALLWLHYHKRKYIH